MIAALGAPAAAMAAPPTSIPASFHGSDVYLKVSVNGAAPVWMKFDIGAAESSIAAAYVHGDARQAARMTLTLGTVTLPGIYFDVAKTAPGVAPDGGAVVGKLGQDWLGTRMVEVRYREHDVLLSAPIDADAPRAMTVASR